jgi:hypothetical protein
VSAAGVVAADIGDIEIARLHFSYRGFDLGYLRR